MTKIEQLSCFKTYDIRGKLNLEINEKIAFRIGYATAKKLKARTVVVGYDARDSSPSLAIAVIEGIQAYGADVLGLGLAGTEEVYHAVAYFDADAGIEVTASHNPINYNGMKIIKACSKPLTEDEFSHIKFIAENDDFANSVGSGQLKDFGKHARELYIGKISSFVKLNSLKPLKIVLNSGNGAAGPIVDELEHYLKNKGIDTHFIKVNHEPNPSFPNGIPNPLLIKNRSITSDYVKKEKADFGVAFDGDFDRCFLFDHRGNFISSEYILGILAEIFLTQERSASIVHDARVIWNILDVVSCHGGNTISVKTGHAFVKAAMREKLAIFGGEMSGHYYFRDFYYCDSGMIPWLLIWELISKKNTSLSDLVVSRQQKFPSSGEINFKISKPDECLEKIKEQFETEAICIDEIDGLSAVFDEWRFNLRKSNTEKLVRLNVESRGDMKILADKTRDLKKSIVSDYK